MTSKLALSKIKTASTLLITCPLKNRLNNYDYNITLLKRSRKMRVWPGFHVFPGGGYDSMDQLAEWRNVLSTTNSSKIINKNSLGRLFDATSDLPHEISYRLCAIRETFEETGLLLAHEKIIKVDEPKLNTSYYSKSDLKQWQETVRKDSKQFLNMCLELDVVPDVNGLHEWSNWITPETEKRRFNTFFFTCFLNSIPKSELFSLDLNNEIECMNMYTPEEALEKHKKNQIKFIPPQLYEFTKISKFNDFKQLAEYSLHRQNFGLIPWLPKFTSDGLIGILPGDYMYETISNSKITSTELSGRLERDKKENSGLKLNRLKILPNNVEIMRNYDFNSN